MGKLRNDVISTFLKLEAEREFIRAMLCVGTSVWVYPLDREYCAARWAMYTYTNEEGNVISIVLAYRFNNAVQI